MEPNVFNFSRKNSFRIYGAVPWGVRALVRLEALRSFFCGRRTAAAQELRALLWNQILGML
jgi:hypothetical protein